MVTDMNIVVVIMVDIEAKQTGLQVAEYFDSIFG
jgi:hypothetical protein